MAGRSRNREDAAVRRAQIVDQALLIVGELGYHGFTIQGLAERCGISNAGLLYYFGSKDKLLLALLDEFERRGENRVERLVVSATLDAQTPEQTHAATLTLLRDLVAQLLEDIPRARFFAALQLESMNEAHPAHDWFRDREVETIELFTGLAGPWTQEPLSAARQLYALMNGLGQQWLRDCVSFDLAGEWEKAVQVILPAPDSCSRK